MNYLDILKKARCCFLKKVSDMVQGEFHGDNVSCETSSLITLSAAITAAEGAITDIQDGNSEFDMSDFQDPFSGALNIEVNSTLGQVGVLAGNFPTTASVITAVANIINSSTYNFTAQIHGKVIKLYSNDPDNIGVYLHLYISKLWLIENQQVSGVIKYSDDPSFLGNIKSWAYKNSLDNVCYVSSEDYISYYDDNLLGQYNLLADGYKLSQVSPVSDGLSLFFVVYKNGDTQLVTKAATDMGLGHNIVSSQPAYTTFNANNVSFSLAPFDPLSGVQLYTPDPATMGYITLGVTYKITVDVVSTVASGTQVFLYAEIGGVGSTLIATLNNGSAGTFSGTITAGATGFNAGVSLLRTQNSGSCTVVLTNLKIEEVVANPQEMAAMDIVPTSPTYRQVTYKRMVLTPENNFMQPNSIMYNPSDTTLYVYGNIYGLRHGWVALNQDLTTDNYGLVGIASGMTFTNNVRDNIPSSFVTGSGTITGAFDKGVFSQNTNPLDPAYRTITILATKDSSTCYGVYKDGFVYLHEKNAIYKVTGATLTAVLSTSNIKSILIISSFWVINIADNLYLYQNFTQVKNLDNNNYTYSVLPYKGKYYAFNNGTNYITIYYSEELNYSYAASFSSAQVFDGCIGDDGIRTVMEYLCKNCSDCDTKITTTDGVTYILGAGSGDYIDANGHPIKV